MRFLNELTRHLAKHSAHERANGNESKANALACIGFGILFLPIPIIGLPLICYGLYKAFD
jgi:hypothetical protein